MDVKQSAERECESVMIPRDTKVKGGGTPGYVTYGATKRGLPQMTESLVKEIEATS